MSETRTIHDPFLGKDVQISDKLTDRLRGRYACGPMLPSGEPEFGWRQHDTAPIQIEAAVEIDRLRDLLLQRGQEYSRLQQSLVVWASRVGDAVRLLRPFAELAAVLDHFKKLPDSAICSFRIDGRRNKGPTASDCREARDFINEVMS